MNAADIEQWVLEYDYNAKNVSAAVFYDYFYEVDELLRKAYLDGAELAPVVNEYYIRSGIPLCIADRLANQVAIRCAPFVAGLLTQKGPGGAYDSLGMAVLACAYGGPDGGLTYIRELLLTILSYEYSIEGATDNFSSWSRVMDHLQESIGIPESAVIEQFGPNGLVQTLAFAETVATQFRSHGYQGKLRLADILGVEAYAAQIGDGEQQLQRIAEESTAYWRRSAGAIALQGSPFFEFLGSALDIVMPQECSQKLDDTSPDVFLIEFRRATTAISEWFRVQKEAFVADGREPSFEAFALLQQDLTVFRFLHRAYAPNRCG